MKGTPFELEVTVPEKALLRVKVVSLAERGIAVSQWVCFVQIDHQGSMMRCTVVREGPQIMEMNAIDGTMVIDLQPVMKGCLPQAGCFEPGWIALGRDGRIGGRLEKWIEGRCSRTSAFC
jgi:hypothetical protein